MQSAIVKSVFELVLGMHLLVKCVPLIFDLEKHINLKFGFPRPCDSLGLLFLMAISNIKFASTVHSDVYSSWIRTAWLSPNAHAYYMCTLMKNIQLRSSSENFEPDDAAGKVC